MAFNDTNIQLEGKRVCFFKGREILVTSSEELVDSDYFSHLSTNDILQALEDCSTHSVAIELAEHHQPMEGYSFIQIRRFFAQKDGTISAHVARLRSLLNWKKSTRFCCHCGAPLQLHSTENALQCTQCEKTHFPRIEPCIIVLVHKENQVLLLRHKQRNQDVFSCLAGFMEVGETVEQAVEREIKEETGLEVENIRYMGSQGWPFPDQLMLAFYADYKSGEIKVQEEEILEAKWFDKEQLPNIPQPGSIAWKLIHNRFGRQPLV